MKVKQTKLIFFIYNNQDYNQDYYIYYNIYNNKNEYN